MRSDSAFSGLEAAVIMIAFVVVAAVFAYSILGLGFFSTQKFQQVTFAGIKQATTTTITDGLIRGQYDESSGGLTSLSFSISVPETSEAISLADMVYYYARNNEAGDVIPLTSVTPHDGILRAGDSSRIRIDLAGAGRAGPLAGGSFSLEIKPPTGASTLIQRTLPSGYEGGYLS